MELVGFVLVHLLYGTDLGTVLLCTELNLYDI